MSYISETAQYRHETLPYCQGNGIDLGSGGDPIKTDGCISFDIGGGLQANVEGSGINFYGNAMHLSQYFNKNIFRYIYSSHLLEDFSLENWGYALREWIDCLDRDGNLVLLVPSHKLYRASAGENWNRSHQHEPEVGELTTFFGKHFPSMQVIHDRLAKPEKYTILFVARKP